MHEIIDVASDVGELADRLREAGVRVVIRYYNHGNSTRLPTKCLTRQELQALHEAGLSVAVVFEQRGGAGGNLSDLDAASGGRDGSQALSLATRMEQPQGSAIYFAVDSDFFRRSELDQIAEYFRQAKSALAGNYLVGVYGSGAVGGHLQKQGLVDHVWLAGALGWSGTRDALSEQSFTIFQQALEKRSEIGGFIYDGNVFNPSHANFGQFGADGVRPSPRGEGAAALFRVAARSTLNLRSGPGESFEVNRPVPNGTIVTGRGLEGPWMKVDLEGDGQVDGYMFARFLAAVSGGLPADPGAVLSPSGPGAPPRPIDFARDEMMRDVREVPGSASNPRIVMYHRTTHGREHGRRDAVVLVLCQLLRRAGRVPGHRQQSGDVLARGRLGPRRHRGAGGRRHRRVPAARPEQHGRGQRRPCRLFHQPR